MDGSATFTMVASSTIINVPRHSTPNAIQRERSVKPCFTASTSRGSRPESGRASFHLWRLTPRGDCLRHAIQGTVRLLYQSTRSPYGLHSKTATNARLVCRVGVNVNALHARERA